MRSKTPLGVICTIELGWQTVRRRWQKALPLEFEDVRFFNPEEFQKSRKAFGSRSLREMLNTRAAAKAARASGTHTLLVATNTDAGLLPAQGLGRFFIYMDAAHAQARHLYSHRPPNLRMKRRIGRMRELARAGHFFLCMSRLAAHGAAEEYRPELNQIRIVPPPVDTDLFAPTARLPGDRPRVLFLGGQFMRKGGDVLLELCKDPDFEDWEWVFVTRDEHRSQCNAAFHTNLVPESSNLVSAIQSCDVLVLPTRADAHSLAALECHSCGLPVIIRNMGAASEIVEDGISGFVIDRTDARAVKAALLKYEDAALRQAHGLAGRQSVLQQNALSVHARLIREATEA